MTASITPSQCAPVLSEAEYAQFQRLIYKEAGIALSDAKHTFVANRLAQRVRELELTSYGAYYRRVAGGDAGELTIMLNAIAIHETQFFREEQQFELLGGACCADWTARAAAGDRLRRVRVWSAACSTGEEPYSIAMVLHDRLRTQGWDVEIVASDLSTAALARARSAVWPIDKLDHVPKSFVKRHFFRGVASQTGRARLGPDARGLVEFKHINLSAARYPLSGKFDAIFCRNTLIYFDAASRARVLDRLIGHLAPGGYLFLGHSESLIGSAYPLHPVIPAVYRLGPRPDATGARRAR